MNTLALLDETFRPVAGRCILDIGCGGGLLAAALIKRGAVVVGIDPDPDAVATARTKAPDMTVLRQPAEALPFADASFDGCVFLNSLHHVPAQAMAQALTEASRVAGASRPVVIIEPLAEGSFFEAFLPVEDETEVRALAQGAIDAALAGGLLVQKRAVIFERVERFASFAAFLAAVTAGDPARIAAAAVHADAVAAAFARVAVLSPDGRFALHQPLLARVLEAPA
ncbi:putative methyltransferase [bacterium YEK0313]|nr:putative methyltransferase [bacterium YEK0313]